MQAVAVILLSMTVCFIGHRKVDHPEELAPRIHEVAAKLISCGADTFLFGSKSQFDNISLNTITELKQVFPSIKRIYIRAEYPVIDTNYQAYLLQFYEETYFPENLEKAGRSVYIQRNQVMIDKSDICVFYYNSSYIPPQKSQSKKVLAPSNHKKSGTAMAYAYAKQKNKQIINLYNESRG